MSEQLHEWCLELLTKATGKRVPDGHSFKEEEYKWHGFATPGYRNTDVVNSMIAFFYENPYIATDYSPWWASSKNKTAVKEYMKWVEEHVDGSDWSDVELKARDVIPYISTYRLEPQHYLIECNYLPWEMLATF